MIHPNGLIKTKNYDSVEIFCGFFGLEDSTLVLDINKLFDPPCFPLVCPALMPEEKAYFEMYQPKNTISCCFWTELFIVCYYYFIMFVFF